MRREGWQERWDRFKKCLWEEAKRVGMIRQVGKNKIKKGERGKWFDEECEIQRKKVWFRLII